ncbi:MAG: hypothetical protein IPH35_06070 [Rhodoferax sp.]|nr:hypothetical protein [Rhodoferax sp.]
MADGRFKTALGRARITEMAVGDYGSLQAGRRLQRSANLPIFSDVACVESPLDHLAQEGDKR